MPEHSTTFALAAGLGLVAGMRSMAAPALLSRHLAQTPASRRDGWATRLLAARPATLLLPLFATAEATADKTPVVPDRTEPPALIGRALSGALCGAAIAGRRGGSRVGAALVGAAAAVGATFAAYHLRKAVGEHTGLPDAVVALAEDALVWFAGTRLAEAVG